MNKPVLLAHNTISKVVVIKEDRVRVYKYTETPADILNYSLSEATKDIIRSLCVPK